MNESSTQRFEAAQVVTVSVLLTNSQPRTILITDLLVQLSEKTVLGIMASPGFTFAASDAQFRREQIQQTCTRAVEVYLEEYGRGEYRSANWKASFADPVALEDTMKQQPDYSGADADIWVLGESKKTA